MLSSRLLVHIRSTASIFAAFIMLGASADAAGENRVTVFAAASLTNAMQDIGNAYEAKARAKLVFSFAASSLLAKQIELGGGVDIFFSADSEWMDYLDKKELLAQGTRHDLLGNRLVLISPTALPAQIRIEKDFPLAQAVGTGRLALADPDSVPAGRYARAALISLGVWKSLVGHLALAENVRMALAYVARGETSFGIVYDTDARIEPKVHVVDTFPEDTHPPILYPVALTKDAKPEAKAFLAYLDGAAARVVFEKYGFKIVKH